MRMRCLIAGLLLAVMPLVVQARPVRFAVMPEKTAISFTIDALGYPSTRGDFRSFRGSVAIDLDNPERSSVTFTAAAASLDTGSRGLNETILSPSFLYAERFPSISFASTSVVRTGEHTVEVTGNMTLLGVTRPARFEVEVSRMGEGGRAFGFVAHGEIRRTDFGMNSGFPIVANTVSITVSTEAVRSE